MSCFFDIAFRFCVQVCNSSCVFEISDWSSQCTIVFRFCLVDFRIQTVVFFHSCTTHILESLLCSNYRFASNGIQQKLKHTSLIIVSSNITRYQRNSHVPVPCCCLISDYHNINVSMQALLAAPTNISSINNT